MDPTTRETGSGISKTGIGCLVLVVVLLAGSAAAYLIFNSAYPYPEDTLSLKERVNYSIASRAIVDRASKMFSEKNLAEKKETLADLIHRIFVARAEDKIAYEDISALRKKFESFHNDQKIETREFEILEKDVRDILRTAGIEMPEVLEEEIDRLKTTLTEKGENTHEQR